MRASRSRVVSSFTIVKGALIEPIFTSWRFVNNLTH